MMAAAAATSGGRVRRQHQRELIHFMARESFLRKRKEQQKKAAEVFDKLASCLPDHGNDNDKTGEKYLAESQITDFLEALLEIPKESLDPNAVQLVKDTATKKQQQHTNNNNQDTTTTTTTIPQQVQDGHYFTQKALLNAFDKYGAYVKNHKHIDFLFYKFDKDRDGCLSRTELGNALQDHERANDRAVNGLRICLVVQEKDLDFILQQADVDHSGKISRAELLPAIAVWEELAQLHLEEKQKNMMFGCGRCIIL